MCLRVKSLENNYYSIILMGYLFLARVQKVMKISLKTRCMKLKEPLHLWTKYYPELKAILIYSEAEYTLSYKQIFTLLSNSNICDTNLFDLINQSYFREPHNALIK